MFWRGRSIDLILTNSKNFFHYCLSMETGLSDNHYLIFSMMKTKLPLQEYLMNIWRKTYHQSLILTSRTTWLLRITLLMFLKKHAPKRTKKFRGNYRPHIFKTLRLAIVKGSRLKNKANKTNELAINKIIENNKTKLNMH